jgi:enoyl-CoA hydratase/carnithine racemase
MFLMAEMIKADEALRIGLVSEISDHPIESAFLKTTVSSR